MNEHLLGLGLTHLHFYLHLRPVRERTRLIILYRKLVAGTGNYEGLIDAANYLGAVQRSIIEFLQALMLLYLFGADSVRFGCRVTCYVGRLIDTKSWFDDAW